MKCKLKRLKVVVGATALSRNETTLGLSHLCYPKNIHLQTKSQGGGYV
ncbi:hypothetical protein Dthio_PD0069 [Desulfonatronospira thiodismutans ASO3-1]|uniref:Uncharacterized protein n=1 Tax=Desulfonatronospira thiodismutans ASO3-1 TaxID=555779 RepID=D6SV20_9BACT|nr:hypothetical protein Dthio_PD0069 [Desulfonatronospira thiodismutans ASO3-1]